MRIYVSGPAELHAETVARLNDNGMTVVNPEPAPSTITPWPPAADFVALVNADGIYLIPGWSEAGPRVEFERAVATHLQIRTYGARA